MNEVQNDLTAADLPDGSIVVDDLKGVAYYAGGEGDHRWFKTADGKHADSVVDYAIRHGATVARIGDDAALPAMRKRLARHLYLKQAKTDQWRQIFIDAWNDKDFDRTPWLTEADELLAVIAGKD